MPLAYTLPSAAASCGSRRPSTSERRFDNETGVNAKLGRMNRKLLRNRISTIMLVSVTLDDFPCKQLSSANSDTMLSKST